VTTVRRPAVSPSALFLVTLAILAVARGPAAPATPSPQPSASAPATSPSPALTAVPGGASPVVGASVGPPTTTETECGLIYDSLPSSFPKLAGQSESEIGSATSGTFVVNGDATALARTLDEALTSQGWSVDVGSPLEDGTVVLEATGAQAGCKTEVRFTPVSGTVMMSVLYGASCPFG
jgi:hypothetical protein